MNYILKIIKISGVIFLVILTAFAFYIIALQKSSPTLEKALTRLGLLEKPYEYDSSQTPKEHLERFGIEIIELPLKDERKLHSMIGKAIVAGFRYYETEKEEEFEKVKSFFLPEEYERMKENINRLIKLEKIWKGIECKADTEFSKIKFSQIGRYKELENRIRISTSILLPFSSPDVFGSGCSTGFGYIFIFKQVDNEWKIEKIRGIGPSPLEIEEQYIIQEIKEGSKK